jgi:hypothetical protein
MWIRGEVSYVGSAKGGNAVAAGHQNKAERSENSHDQESFGSTENIENF